MRIIRHPISNANTHTPSAITIGNFDGVHFGHATILNALVHHAKAHKLKSCVITFSPSPKAFFAAQHNKPEPKRIMPLRDKLRALQQHGIDEVVILSFNHQLAQMQATDFIKHILVRSLNMKFLLIGDDFRFGAQRTGNFTLLQEQSHIYQYIVQAHDSVIFNNDRISSSSIRKALGEGDIQQATQLLGHPYTLSGHIIYGQQLGRTIGVPTINVKMPNNLAAQGIYAVTAQIEGQTYQGVSCIGNRPSVKSNGQCWCEVHLFDFNQNVYGKTVQVHLHHKIRDEEKFDDMNTLIMAIKNDILQARYFFATKQTKQPHQLP